MDIKLKDKKAREKIRCELAASFFVEAGAGSGKTYSLVERMVNLISSGAASIEHIAAVTFTRKAAAELSERFQIGLEESLKNDTDAERRDNIRSALSSLEQVFIGTIHSFCSAILRERPVEARIDPGFIEVEEDRDIFYAERAWASYIEEAGISGDNILELLREIGIKPSELKDTYLKFARYPEVEIVTEITEKPDLADAKERIRKEIEFFIDAMPDIKPEKGWDVLGGRIKKASNLISSGYLDSDGKFIDLLNELNKKTSVTQNRWPDGNGNEYLKKFKKFQEETVRPVLKSWQQYLHGPLSGFIKKGVDYYSRWRRDHGILNFADLLTGTADLLRSSPGVRQYFKERFTHILVDEFQDTDPVQAEIILFLTGSDSSEKNWRNISPAPGSLFVVGDPKQSIYRFRRADIDIYNMVKKIFTDGAGEVLELYSNFRSLPFMADTVDKVFKPLFPENHTKYQARFFPLETVRKLNSRCIWGVFENSIDPVKGHRAEEIARIDASRIAGWIKACVSGSIMIQDEEGEMARPGYSDFLILTRYKKNLPIYGRALELIGIPYDISGGESFSQSSEAAELYRLLKAVDDERDPVALITALRGMFFGISDDRLFRFKKSGGRFNYFSIVPDGFSEFDEAFKMLKDFKNMLERYEPLVAAEKIIEKLGIMPYAVCSEEGLTRAGNIYKALELLKDRENGGNSTFSDLLDKFKELLGAAGIESMSITSAGDSSVRIMNLHRAKGLEAPIVILADPMGAGGNHEPDYHIERSFDGRAAGYFKITKPLGSYGTSVIAIPPEWHKKLEEEMLYEEAEQRRLEYVAVTRAKNILVVSTYRESTKKKAWEFMHGFLTGMEDIDTKNELDTRQREIFEVSEDDWEDVKKSIGENIDNMGKPGYVLTNVTTEAKEGVLFSEPSGQGMSWGRIVHKAVELVSRGNGKLKILAGSWIREEGRDIEDLGRIIALIEKFKDSQLWKRIDSAEHKYFEVPFALQEDGSIVYGVIDAVFKEDGEWVIVDYKTDDFENDPERKRAYEKQVEMYGKYWEKISGEKVKEKLLVKLI